MRLGKKLPRIDPRTLKLGKYLPTVPAAPPVCDWLSGIKQWGMMGNDVLGDCTFAGIGHAIQVWTAGTGTEITLGDEVIVDHYSRWAGYVAGDPSTDNGAVELDVLNRWRKEGIGSGPDLMHNIFAYADPDPQNPDHIRQSIWLFGGVYIGLALPLTAQDQEVWDVVGDGSSEAAAPYSWGGHCVFVPYYNDLGLACITWGGLQRMTWRFWKKYCDEAHAILSEDWVSKQVPTQMGFDLGTLSNDLGAIVG